MSNVQTAIERARARLAELGAARATQQQQITDQLAERKTMLVPTLKGWQIDDSRDWNEQQQSAIHSGLAGKSFVLIGAAGTGKTSCLKGLVNSLIKNSLLPIISSGYSTPNLPAGKPGILLCSFTNMAVRQIAKHFSKDINICTIHKVLEFEPVYYEIANPDGTVSKTMRFEPQRNANRPLPNTLRTIIVDEASMPSIELIQQLVDALPQPDAVQWIFVGDLNQLPPVYGAAILGKKLLELPIVELTQVYRQALLSPIITVATDMKNGKLVPLSSTKQVIDAKEHGKLTIHPWSAQLGWEDALTKAADFCKAAIMHEQLDVHQDMILCPYNVKFGVIELNSRIADWLGRQRDAKVYEIVAGFNTHYYALGDKVLVRKREAIITGIQWNKSYYGKHPTNPEKFQLDRWGGAKKRESATAQTYEEELDDNIDAILAQLSETTTVVEDRKTSSSHIIKVRYLNGTNPKNWKESDSLENCEEYEVATLDTASAVNEMLFAYAITVHKSQGSEWRKVFITLHQSHAKMCYRELLYTAITRAREECYIICEPDRGIKIGTLSKAAKNPRLKGNTLAEKLASLKEKFDQEAAEKQRAADEEEGE